MADIDTSFYPQAQPNSLVQNVTGALEARNLGQQNQLLQTANQSNQFDLLAKKQGMFNDMVGSLLSDPGVNYDKVMQAGQQAVNLGFFSPDILQQEAAVFKPTDTPQEISQKLQVIATRGISALDNLNRNVGQAASINTGPNTLTGQMNAKGAFTPASAVQNAMGPGEAATPVSVINPDGSTTLTTKGQFAGTVGGNSLTGGAPAGPNALTPAGGGAAQPQSGPATVPGITGPSPQQQAMNTASGAQYQAAKENDAGYTANVVPLQKMIELLPKTQTGLGAETVTNLAKVASTFGINLPGTADQAQYYSELEKYANVLARSSGAAPNSDAQLLAAMSSNPNVTMNNAAAQDVAKVMLALQRMQHATVTAAQAANVSPEQYSTFAQKWGAQQDPRAYGFDLLDPAAKTALRKELDTNPAEAAKFVNSYNIAKQVGVLGSPTTGATGGQ